MGDMIGSSGRICGVAARAEARVSGVIPASNRPAAVLRFTRSSQSRASGWRRASMRVAATVVSVFSPVAAPRPTHQPATNSLARVTVEREYRQSAIRRRPLPQRPEYLDRPHPRIRRRRVGIEQHRPGRRDGAIAHPFTEIPQFNPPGHTPNFHIPIINKILDLPSPSRRVFQIPGVLEGEAQRIESLVKASQFHRRRHPPNRFHDGQRIRAGAQSDIPYHERLARLHALIEPMLRHVQHPRFFHRADARVERLAMLAGSKRLGAAGHGYKFE